MLINEFTWVLKTLVTVVFDESTRDLLSRDAGDRVELRESETSSDMNINGGKIDFRKGLPILPMRERSDGANASTFFPTKP